MRAGLMWDMCSFQEARPVSDDIGGTTIVFSGVFQAWGWLRMERGLEALEAGRLQSSNMGVLTIRESDQARAVTPGWRVVIDQDPWQIRSIVDGPGRDRTLELLVERGTAQ